MASWVWKKWSGYHQRWYRPRSGKLTAPIPMQINDLLESDVERAMGIENVEQL